mgnify:CR=1 FL=1
MKKTRCNWFFSIVFRFGWLGYCAVNAYADTAVKDIRYFDLPGQSLQSALIEFAVQADITIIANEALIRKKLATPIMGPRTVDIALAQLLAKADLAYIYSQSSNSYSLTPSPASSSNSPEPLASEAKFNDQIDETLVFGASHSFRYNTISSTQLHGEIPYFDSARFINVLPSSLINDQQAEELAEIVKFASSVTPGDGVADSNDDILIRGFPRHATFLDGFRLGDSTGVKIVPANVERIEILKGPSTILYGQGEPGGTLNIVRKKPLKENHLWVDVGMGSGDHLSADVDINVSPESTPAIQYRAIMANDKQRELGDNSDLLSQLFSGAVSWAQNDNTQFSLRYDYQYSEFAGDRDFDVFRSYGDFFPGATLAEVVPQARQGFSAYFNLLTAELNHYLSPTWRLRARTGWQNEFRYGVRTTGEQLLRTDILFRKEELGEDLLIFSPGGQAVIAVVLDIARDEWRYEIAPIRSLYDEDAEENALSFNTSLEGAFSLFDRDHHATFGFDFHRQEVDTRYVVEVRDVFANQSWNGLELEAELSNILNTILASSENIGLLEEHQNTLTYSDVGLFMQDSVELSDRLVASFGARYTMTEGNYTDTTNYISTRLNTHSKLSAQAGLVFRIDHNNSFFSNYSEGLKPNYQLDDSLYQVDEPELSKQTEIGIKTRLFNNRLLASVAAFEIGKWNVAELRVIEGVRTSVTNNRQFSRGVDLDFTLRLYDSINLVGAAAILSPEILNGENKGNRQALAAKKTSSLFAHYELSSALDFSLGYKFVGGRYANDDNTYYLEPYTTFDLGCKYQMHLQDAKLNIKVAIKNLLDQGYYTALLSGVRENRAVGRSMMASVQVEL